MGDSKNKDRRNGINSIPEHLKRWPGLYVRKGGQIVDASKEDISVARGYPISRNKGPILDGKRLTLLTEKTAYQVNEEIHVIHVVELIEPGHHVYVMGPKKIYGEYVDGRLVTEPLPKRGDPLVPLTYSGTVLPSPAVDYNYEITTYTFSKPGIHRIWWKIGSLQSNTLTLSIQKTAEPPPENRVKAE